MAKKSAANMQTALRLEELTAQVKNLSTHLAGDAQVITEQSITIADVRETIHAIANQVAGIAASLPGIIDAIEQIARWVAAQTEEQPQPQEPPAAAKKAAKK